MMETYIKLDKIISKWKVAVLFALADSGLETMRNKDLKAAIPQASDKTLSKALLSLEREDGLIGRKFTHGTPCRTDYWLTEKGHAFMPLLRQLKDWVEVNLQDGEEE